ncbi:MAG: hypothetical protein H7259_00335, partial [Cytophagales bacterium]|nr:hypothetical protein [Cytophaga sp.]
MDITIGKPVIAGNDTIPGVIDSMIITLTVHGDSVKGVFSWLPGEKDKMTGTLNGTIKDSIVTAVYSYMA